MIHDDGPDHNDGVPSLCVGCVGGGGAARESRGNGWPSESTLGG